jgi:hypothetical protein
MQQSEHDSSYKTFELPEYYMPLFVGRSICFGEVTCLEVSSLSMGIFESRKRSSTESNSDSASAVPFTLLEQQEINALHGPEKLTFGTLPPPPPKPLNTSSTAFAVLGAPSSMRLSCFSMSLTPTFEVVWWVALGQS